MYVLQATIIISEESEMRTDDEIRSIGSSLPFQVLLNDDGSWYPSSVIIDSAKDAALIMFSSGTTGPQKGVMLSHRNVVATMTLIEYVSSCFYCKLQRVHIYLTLALPGAGKKIIIIMLTIKNCLWWQVLLGHLATVKTRKPNNYRFDRILNAE